jgi:hypothetical protein
MAGIAGMGAVSILKNLSNSIFQVFCTKDPVGIPAIPAIPARPNSGHRLDLGGMVWPVPKKSTTPAAGPPELIHEYKRNPLRPARPDRRAAGRKNTPAIRPKRCKHRNHRPGIGAPGVFFQPLQRNPARLCGSPWWETKMKSTAMKARFLCRSYRPPPYAGGILKRRNTMKTVVFSVPVDTIRPTMRPMARPKVPPRHPDPARWVPQGACADPRAPPAATLALKGRFPAPSGPIPRLHAHGTDKRGLSALFLDLFEGFTHDRQN